MAARRDPETSTEAKVLAAADDGVDVSLIRWTLSLSPDERLAVLQDFVDSLAAIKRGPPQR